MKRRSAGLLAAIALVPTLMSQASPDSDFSPYVDVQGNISRPRDFRENWAHLGTYFVKGESPNDDSLHSVYAEKHHLDAFNKTGEWPDGAVLVKEVRHTTGSQLTTGAANWATQPDVWFVVVKDSGKRFPDNPLWGDGWGWALFKSDAPATQVATGYKKDCLNCHVPAKQTDYIYIQGYPAIQRGRGAEKTEAVAMQSEGDLEATGGSAERGAAIFAETCIFCHTVKDDRRKLGPSLAVIARENRLPSGKQGSPQNILNQINNGGGGMPAFADSLDAHEKADLIAYIRRPR